MMTGEQLHLAINHLPIVGAFLGLALVLLWMVRRADAGVLHAATLVLGLSAVGAVSAYLSGEEAEEAAEARPGFDHDLVEEHEEAALPGTVLLGLSALIGVGLSVAAARGRAVPALGAAGWLAVTALSAAAMTQQGLSGRNLGHPEVYGIVAAP